MSNYKIVKNTLVLRIATVVAALIDTVVIPTGIIYLIIWAANRIGIPMEFIGNPNTISQKIKIALLIRLTIFYMATIIRKDWSE